MGNTVLKMDESIVLALGTKLYSQPLWWVLTKELMQNALDAGATNIYVTTDFDKELEFLDDGNGMTKQELLDVFLTVGASDKIKTSQTIGGFGIAKLAIFSCDDFFVKSGKYGISKTMLLNHSSLKASQIKPINGFHVYVEKKNLFRWNGEKELKWYLSAIDRDVNIYLNDELITKFVPAITTIGSGTEQYSVIPPMSYGTYEVLVRANGLPLFKSYISSPSGNDFPGIIVLYDIRTSSDPYSEDYPFNVTREAFSDNSDHVGKLSSITSKIGRSLNEIREVEITNKRNVFKDEEAELWYCFNPDVTEKTLKALEWFKSRIKLLYMLNGEDCTCEFGIIGKEDEDKKIIASYQEEKDSGEVFYLSDSTYDRCEITAAAIHEFSHRKHQNHYEEFAREMTRQTEKYLRFLQEVNIAKETA